jgi:hypothetical protein
MRGEFLIDITATNNLLDRQRRVIEEVTRRCFFKGNNRYLYCRTCPAWEGCDVKNFPKEERRHASQY